ncbi:hypothetical protein DRQ33_07600 [bacterium]|nr:MAG: hypothetical protein DRQ33_07600 [bacterium]
MQPEQLGHISTLLHGTLEPDEASRVYTRAVSVDSRQLNPGELFFALIDERNGHDFIMDAYTKGAIAAVVNHKLEIPIPQIIVRDTLVALGQLAAAYRQAIAPKTVAITGSVGKTTAREMIATVLKSKFKTHSAKHNYNNLIGLPLTLLDMNKGTEIAVVELGINQPGEMERLVEISQPDIALITAIAPVHTEGLDGIDKILSEKLKITNGLSSDAPLLLNTDFPKLAEVTETAHNRIITYAIDSEADFRASNVRFRDGKSSFSAMDVDFELDVLGKAPIYAALATIATADVFGISAMEVAQILKNFPPQIHRMQLLQVGNIKILDDSYNSSPIALAEAIETMSKLTAHRKIAILGDMLELGTFEEQYHREVIKLLLKYSIDGAVFFGKCMKYAFNESNAADFPGGLFWSDDYDDTLRTAQKIIKDGDMVLIKGSHAMQMDRFVHDISIEWEVQEDES